MVQCCDEAITNGIEAMSCVRVKVDALGMYVVVWPHENLLCDAWHVLEYLCTSFATHGKPTD